MAKKDRKTCFVFNVFNGNECIGKGLAYTINERTEVEAVFTFRKDPKNNRLYLPWEMIDRLQMMVYMGYEMTQTHCIPWVEKGKEFDGEFHYN